MRDRVAPEQPTVCMICPRGCKLARGQTGWCGVRIASGDSTTPVSKQAWQATGIGTIEDHALYHFFPGMKTLGLGSVGCSAECDYCQNWELALAPRFGGSWVSRPVFANDREIIDDAQRYGCGAVVFSYNEVTVWPEGFLRVADLAHKSSLRVVLVTNGYVAVDTLHMLLRMTDAVRLDLKAPDDASYRGIANMTIGPVLETWRLVRSAGIWHEVSTVIVPGMNDGAQAVQEIAGLVLSISGPDTPWHVMRFFPAYKMITHKSGDLAGLRQIRLLALSAGLRYVYISNVPGLHEADTFCPGCGAMLGRRRVTETTLLSGTCPVCSSRIAGEGLLHTGGSY